MDAEEIGLPEQVAAFDTAYALFGGLLVREVLAPGDGLHAERLAQLGDIAAEPAGAEQAERRAVEAAPDGGLPASLLHSAVLERDVACPRQHQESGRTSCRERVCQYV